MTELHENAGLLQYYMLNTVIKNVQKFHRAVAPPSENTATVVYYYYY